MHSNNELIQKLEADGFIVRNDNAVIKYSNKTRKKERAGIINEKGVYFFATNVAPYNQGQNSTKDILGDSIEYVYTAPIKEKAEVEVNFTFEDYINTTNKKNKLGIYLETLSNKLGFRYNNDYNIRGVRDGYMAKATLFPYFNYNNEFQTAKIVKYNTVTGKRNQDQYSNNTFHKYKPILKYLDIDGSVSKSINCFFGEHLVVGNNRTVVIVESEKTAIILGMMYINIVFIATGGASNLERLEWDFLNGRNVIVYPDKGVQEWFKIADQRDWMASNILEFSNDANKGDDVEDFVNHNLWALIDAELSEINRGNVEFLSAKDLKFTPKKRNRKVRCTPNFKDIGFTRYWDNSEGEKFSGKAFDIYKDSFQSINANIDFNANELSEDGSREPFWYEYLRRLMKCFFKTKHLNSKKDYTTAFKGFLHYLNAESNYTVNIKYVENYLIPYWESIDVDVKELEHTRNWILTGKIIGNDDYAFIRELNEDRAIARTYYLLRDLKPLISEYRFIDTKGLGMKRRRDNPFIWSLVEQYNKEVIGCTTENQFNNLLEFEEYAEHLNETALKLGGFYKRLNNLPILYRSTLSSVGRNLNHFSEPSIKTVHENTSITKELITKFFKFTPDNKLFTDTNILISYLLEFTTDYKLTKVKETHTITRGKNIGNVKDVNRIITMPNKTAKEITEFYKAKEEVVEVDAYAEALEAYVTNKNLYLFMDYHKLTPQEAFNTEADFTHSPLNCSLEDAKTRGNEFLSSWILFKYPNISEEDRICVKANAKSWTTGVDSTEITNEF